MTEKNQSLTIRYSEQGGKLRQQSMASFRLSILLSLCPILCSNALTSLTHQTEFGKI